MSQPVIRVENLSKKYHIGSNSADSLREALTNTFRRFTGRSQLESQDEIIWALRDIDLEVHRGEVLGIIGHNGAGKSTLLKVLSRITYPTSGRIEMTGRVSSLLEVGTGFHPELTGRENIYMNASILGMKRAETQKRFDEIVAFAGVEKFVDTPVKRYSSGMYTRLAFSVAAHLEPEILIVDEVLSVGDAAFQKKSLGKMEDVRNEGRTVLFVSHNMGSVANLCNRTIMIESGRVVLNDTPRNVIAQYIQNLSRQEADRVWVNPADAPGNDIVRLHRICVISRENITFDIDIDHDLKIMIEFWNYDENARITTSILLKDRMGYNVLASANFPSANLINDPLDGKVYPTGLIRAYCTIPANFLNDMRYTIDIFIATDVLKTHIHERDVISFEVHETGEMRAEFSGKWLGVVRPRLAWHTEKIRDIDSGDIPS